LPRNQNNVFACVVMIVVLLS